MWSASAPPIFGFAPIYVYSLRRGTTKFGVVTHMGIEEGCFSGLVDWLVGV